MINIQTHNISKVYYSGDETLYALQGVSLNIDGGSFTSIIGQSGSGKTTLLNIISGLDSPTYGELILDNKDTTKWKHSHWDMIRNRQIGFIFQNFMLLEEFSVIENVMIPYYIQTNNKKLALEKAMHLLNTIQLSHKAKRYPKELSGGELQRIAIIRAIINNPQLILADEPTGNLDKKNQALVMEMLLDLHKEYQFTFIMVTHNLELAKLADQTLKLSFGNLIS